MPSHWRKQGSSPWTRIIPSAGQVEEGLPSLSHPDPYISFRGALWRNSRLRWNRKHGLSLYFSPLKLRPTVNFAKSSTNSSVCVVSTWVVSRLSRHSS